LFNFTLMSTIQINSSFNGKRIQASAGDIIELQLDENPTTGFRWDVSQLDANILELNGDDFQIQSTTGVGGGGTRIFRFNVIGTGNGTVKLSNRQKWSGDEFETFEISLA
jgi:inhibitor of cysteine peptidase